MTPASWQRVAAQRQIDREEFLRAKRADVRDYCIGLACVLAAFVGVILWALPMIEGKL